MKAASRYAKSLLDLALEQGALEAVYQDMIFVLRSTEHNRELQVFLQSPIIKTDKKVAVFNEIFGQLNKVTRIFIELVTRKRREAALVEIASSFIDQYKNYKKIITAVVTTAVGLDDTLRSQVMDIVKKSAQGEVELVEKIDKNIIGGIILRVGDKQVDSSILRNIKNLNRTFAENPYIKEF